jgi:hypothetical protein
MRKTHPNKKREQEFIKKWRTFSNPLKIAIKNELKHNKAPRKAVDLVFKKYKVRQKLQELVMNNVINAIKDGLKNGKR